MVDSKFDVTSQYYSGQGVVMIGLRDVNGNPIGLRPLGNVSELKIAVATTIVDHKNSQDGQRAIDKRLQTEVKPTVSITIDNWIAVNLSKALRGSPSTIPAGNATAESHSFAPGLVTGLKYIDIDTVVLKQASTSLTAYTAVGATWDYKVNADAGSIMLNDGTQDGGYAVFEPTANALVLTSADASDGGDAVYHGTITGGAAGALAGQYFDIAGFAASGAVNNGTGLLCVDSTALTLTVRKADAIDETHAGTATSEETTGIYTLAVDYAYGAQKLTDALTQPLSDVWLRFEGLNTVAENAPVVVDIFRFSTDPLKELALLSDTFGQFVIEGAVLADYSRTVGSKYFSVKSLV